MGSRALDLLIALVERAGEVATKDSLIARVWPNLRVEEANLRVHIAALRKALGDGHAGHRFIVNVPGRGYCFVAPVEHRRAAPPPAVPAPPRTDNLPVPLTRVIGREEVVQALAEQVQGRRFVTIAGPGGIGKTTVALAVAEELIHSYRDQAVFVDLALIGDPVLVPKVLTSALGPAVRIGSAVDGPLDLLRSKEMLVVLDSCEHVLDAVARLAEMLLKGAPDLAIIATSREPLRAEGEWVHRLPPLGLPPASTTLTPAEAMQFPAIQLFVERASAGRGDFELGDAEVPIVAEICRRLDGIALAIELAAGRMDAFGLRELAVLLDDRFRLLTRGRRTALPRHQTLRATLDWSYAHLPEPEQIALRRLAVFSGRFTEAAAEAVVAGGNADALDADEWLANLVAKSLVVAEVAGEAAVRYRLLDTTRAYAREKLADAGELAEFTQRHAEYFRSLFETAVSEWETSPTVEWLERYADQVDNLRAALDWSFSEAGDPEVGVALTVAAVPLSFELSLADERLGWVERALAFLDVGDGRNTRSRMQLHAARGWPAIRAVGGLESGVSAWRTALSLAEELGDRDYQMRALWALWADRLDRGAFAEALALARRFRDLAAGTADAAAQHVGDRLIGMSLHFIGDQAGAWEHIGRMLSRYVAPTRRSHIVRFRYDQRIAARIATSRMLWLQGFPDRAQLEVEDAVQHALSINHVLSLCNLLAQAACPVSLLAGNLAAAERYAAMLREHAAANAVAIWRVYTDVFQGEILLRQGDQERGLPLIRSAVDDVRQTDFVQYLTTFLAWLAQGLAEAGRMPEGLAAVEEALTRCEQTGEGWCLAELQRIKGEILLRQAGPTAAEAAETVFLRSLCIARDQGALSWELRTATSLSLLWHAQDRTREARELLASIHARFVEGFGTEDLVRAAAVLKALEASSGGGRIAVASHLRRRQLT